jgi:hypothetical protein
MNTAFRTPARNSGPVAGQEAAVSIRAKVEGCHRQIIEIQRRHGPKTQKEIANAAGIAEIP